MLKMFERGNPITVVASRHGIAESTFHKWMADSDVAEEDSAFFGFSSRVREAQAKAEDRALKIIMDAAVGGRKVTKTVVKRSDLVTRERDPDWGPGSEKRREVMETDRVLVSEETTTTTYQTLPNPGLARWFLERRNRKDFGNSLALTGAGGKGPVRYREDPPLDLANLSDDDLNALEALYEKAELTPGSPPAEGADPG